MSVFSVGGEKERERVYSWLAHHMLERCIHSETSIHRFRRGSEKKNSGSGKTIDAGAIVEIGFTQGP
jgi:hypothetical protein